MIALRISLAWISVVTVSLTVTCVFVTPVLFFTDSVMSVIEHAHYRIECIVKCARINKTASVIGFSYEICQMLVRVYSHIFNKSAILLLVHWAIDFPLTLQDANLLNWTVKQSYLNSIYKLELSSHVTQHYVQLVRHYVTLHICIICFLCSNNYLFIPFH